MISQERWAKWRHHFKSGIVYVGIAALLGLFLEHWRVYAYLEEITFDSWIQSHQAEPDPRIELVVIDGAAYQGRFDSKSPMDPDKIGALIQLVVEGGARVIGVDIDTSEWKPEHFDRFDNYAMKKIVWAVHETVPYEKRHLLIPGDVAIAPSNIREPSKRNETGIVRALSACRHPAFSAQIAAILLGKERQPWNRLDGGTEEGVYIAFVKRSPAAFSEPDFPTLPLAHLPQKPEDPNRWKEFFKGKAVLIGGTAPLLHDLHETPFGMESGVALQAELVNTALQERFQPVSKWLVFVMDLAAGALVLAITGLLPGRTAWVLLLSLPALAYASFLAFRLFDVFSGFIAIFLGLLAHCFMDFYVRHGKCGHDAGPIAE